MTEIVIASVTASPRPSSSTSSGVSATSGIVCVTSATGRSDGGDGWPDLAEHGQAKRHEQAGRHAEQRDRQRLRQCLQQGLARRAPAVGPSTR